MKENFEKENKKIFRVIKPKKNFDYDSSKMVNDYQYMKDKFENRPFNIISNKERNINY